MRKSFWDKKIPTVFGLLILALGIGVTTFLVQKGDFFPISATTSEEPKDVRISNITDNSFTVSYFTDDKITGVISYGTSSSLGQSGLDDRDQELGKIVPHKIHNFTIRNLQPVTKYYFTIVSGKQTYSNNSLPFEATTGTLLNVEPPAQDPMSGKVITPNGNPPEEAIIYVVAENSQVVSTITKSDGNFVLPLNSLRNQDLSSYFTLELDTSIKLLAIGEGMFSNIGLSTLQSHPVPVITLSNNYDFTLAPAPSASSSGELPGFPPIAIREATKNNNPSIVSPQDDQEFNDQKPQFKGTAVPNEEVQIVINSDQQIQTSVKADSKGNWIYRPQENLDPGEHTITITTRNESGIIKTLKKSFTVYASGTQIAGDKGSPTPTPIPSITTPTSTIAPTVLPTIQQVSESPTISPTVTVDNPLVITATPTLPPTGSSSIMSAAVVGLLLSLMGGLIFLLTRGAI